MNWLRQLFFRHRRYDDLAVSIQEHLEDKIEDLMDDGMSRDEATRTARREFGNVTLMEERSREVWQWQRLESLWADIRYGLRQVRRNPGFAATCIITLTLAVGANTTIFGLIDSIFLTEVTAFQPNRLIHIELGSSSQISYPNYEDLQGLRSLSGLAGYNTAEVNLKMAGSDTTRSLLGEIVTTNFFDVLGVHPFRGRLFTAPEINSGAGSQEAVISYGLARQLAATGNNPMGHVLNLDGRIFTVVGVLPRDFRSLAGYGAAPDVFLPFSNAFGQLYRRNEPSLSLVGRLADGISRSSAAAELRVAAQRLEKDYPDADKEFGEICAVTGVTGLDGIKKLGSDPVLIFFAILLIIVLFVLLIACANIAGLLMARATVRRREFATRIAMGAGRWVLIRQLLMESLVLVFFGSCGGLLLTVLSITLISHATTSLPFPLHVGFEFDSRLTLFSVALLALTTLLCGLVPAFQTARLDIVSALKGEESNYGFRRVNLRSLLVTGQIALSTVLLISTFLSLRSLAVVEKAKPGFDAAHTASVRMQRQSNTDTPEQIKLFVGQAVERTRAVPSVKAASCAAIVPLSFNSSGAGDLRIAGNSDGPTFGSSINAVCPDYFQTMIIGLIKGREFNSEDRAGNIPVVVVNESFARHFLSNQNVIGKQIIQGSGKDRQRYEIVGLVRDSKYLTMGEAPEPMLYFSYFQHNLVRRNTSLVFRTRSSPADVFAAVIKTINDLDPTAIATPTLLQNTVSFATLPNRIAALLLLGLGALALVLAVVGLYGMIAYETLRRTSEIGVRMTFGANRSSVLGMVLRRGLSMIVVGELIGASLAFAIVQPLGMFLSAAVGTKDTLSYIAAILLLAFAGLAAAIRPAVRAMLVSPMQALRSE